MRNSITKFLLSILANLLIASTFIYSQSSGISCGDDSLVTIVQNADPLYNSKVESINLAIKNYIANNLPTGGGNSFLPISSSARYVIPIVVHVIHPNGEAVGTGTNISYTQIESGIDALNAAFAKTYGTTYNNGQSHSPWAVDTKIQFCLAKTPAGTTWTDNSEPGVMRYDASLLNEDETTISVAGANTLLSLTHPSAVYFPFTNYLNIWIVTSIDYSAGATTTVLGYATFPTMTFPLDGVVIRSDVFGDNSYPGNNFSLNALADQGKVLSHEVGHYLNLYHIFQDGCSGNNPINSSSDACDLNGDFICDIDPTTVQAFNCSGVPPASCGHPGTDCKFESYMSYADDDCQNAFSSDQSLRMDATLNIYRGTLWSNQNLVATGVIAPNSCIAPFLMADIFASTGLLCTPTLNTISFTTITGVGNTATTWNWDFTGGSPSSYSGQTPPIVTYPNSGQYTVTLTVSDGGAPLVNTYQVYVSSCALSPNLLSQGNWYFGINAAVSFATGVAVPVTPSMITSSEACACESDPSSGSLLFYTDGRRVWDASHTLMQNLSSAVELNGSPNTANATWSNSTSSQQGALIVPDPQNITTGTKKYYIFTTPDMTYGAGNYANPLSYTIVDMNDHGGLGGVDLGTLNSFPPNPLPSPVIEEGITAIPHCNGIDYWIIVHGYNSGYEDKFISYLLTSDGLSSAVISTSSNYISTIPINSAFEASPNGLILAVTDLVFPNGGIGDCYTYFFDFNPETGEITDRAGNLGGQMYLSTQFSPNSDFFYYIKGSGIYQVDMSTMQEINCASPVPLSSSYVSLQLGPDRRIYINKGYDLVVMNTPNILQTGYGTNEIGMTLVTVNMTPNYGQIALDNMRDADASRSAPTPPQITATLQTASCTDFDFSIACYSSPLYSFDWNFDDGSTGTGNPISHSFANTGQYNVTCTLTVGNHIVITTQQVNVLSNTLAINGFNPFCTGGSYPPVYSVQFLTGATYSWVVTNGTASPIVNNCTVNWNNGATSGTVQVTVSINGCTETATMNVVIADPPVADAGLDFTACLGVASTINGSASGGTTPYIFSWNPATNLTNFNTSTPDFTPSSLGTFVYSIEVTDANGCYSSDNVSIAVSAGPNASATANAVTVCEGDIVELSALPDDPAYTYSWTSTSGFTSNTSNTSDNPVTTTTYTVQITDANGCIAISPPVIVNALTGITNCCVPSDFDPAVDFNFSNKDAIWAIALAGSSTFTTTQTILIDDVFTVNKDFDFYNCPNIILGPNAQIVVVAPFLFEVRSSTMQACSDLWQAIRVGTNGKLHLYDSFILDGEESVAATGTPTIIAHGNHFINNFKAIHLYHGDFWDTHIYANFFESTNFIKFPHVGVYTYSQILIDDAINVRIGDINYGPNEIYDGDFGIKISKSDVSVDNNNFDWFNNPATRTAIYADGFGTTAVNGNTLNVGVISPNNFNHYPRGIYIRTLYNCDITGNTFEDTKLTIEINQCQNRNLSITKNTLTHFDRGISCFDVAGAFLTINENTFNDGLPYDPLHFGYVAIDVENSMFATINLAIENNQAWHVQNGIHLRNINSGLIDQSNQIHYLLPPSDIAGRLMHGIWLENCGKIHIINNLVDWNPTPFINPTQSERDFLSGISIAKSIVCELRENDMQNMGAGINVFGNCSNTNLYCNGMHNCYLGVYLDASGGNNRLTDQGVWNGSAGNSISWNNTWFSNVATDHIDGAIEPGYSFRWMYHIIGGAVTDDPRPTLLPIFQFLTRYCTLYIVSCSPPAPLIDDGKRKAAFGDAVGDSTETSVDSLEFAYDSKENFYKQAKDDSSILHLGLPDDTAFQSEFDSLKLTNIGKFEDVKKHLEADEKQLALQKILSMQDQTVIDQNKITMGYLVAIGYDPYLDSDSDTISIVYSIAVQHPFYGGEAVYTARAMLHIDVQDQLPAYRKTNQHFISESIIIEDKFYPNPTSNEVTFISSKQFGYKAKLALFNNMGSLLLTISLPEKEKQFTFSVASLVNGVYLAKVIKEGSKQKVEKLVIIK